MQPQMSWSNWRATAWEGFKFAIKGHFVSVFGTSALLGCAAMWLLGMVDDAEDALRVGGASVVLACLVLGVWHLGVAPYRFQRKRAEDNYGLYREADERRSGLEARLAEIARREAAGIEAANSEQAKEVRRLKAAQDYWYGVGTALYRVWHEEKRITDVWGHTLKNRFETFAKAYFTEPARLRVLDKIRRYGDASINLGPYKFADALIKTSAELRTALEYEDLAAPEMDHDLSWMHF